MSANSQKSPKVLLLSAYDAASHQYWRHHLAKTFAEYEWTQLALPARHFSWRLRGNSLTWSGQQFDELDKQYDLIIATSATDITALRGFRPNLGQSPLVVYFHENQFAYPASASKHSLVEIQLTSIYNAWCADRVVFNSLYNKRTFFTGAAALLKKLPDGLPKNVLFQIEEKSTVIPVGIEPMSVGSIAESSLCPLTLSPKSPLQLLWNHRWEYDKNPEVFFDAIEQLHSNNIPIELHVVGQQFRNSPEVFRAAQQTFSAIIQHWGYQERQVYLNLLRQCNMVVSSALHDFQGLAIQEAIGYGCVPITPDRLAYQEYVPNPLRYAVDTKNEANELAKKIAAIYTDGYSNPTNPVSTYTWNVVSMSYRALFEQLLQ